MLAGRKQAQAAGISKRGIVTENGVSKEKLDAWLSSNDGQRAQRQWEAHHRRQQALGATGTKPQKGFRRQPEVKRGWSRQKI